MGGVLKDTFFDVVADITAYNDNDIIDFVRELGSFDQYIMISSSAVYPEYGVQPFLEESEKSENKFWGSYGTDKIAAEKALLERVKDAYILRPPYLYGPMNNVYREAFVFDCALADRKFYLPKDGSMKLQFFHVKDLCRLMDLLSGIIMMTALYTVNLRIAGRANVPIYNMTTLFDNALVKKIFTGSLAPFANTIIILVITLIMKFLLDWYMSTKSGYLLRAVGDNETIVTSMGVDKGIIKIIGLAIANGLVTLSGCIFAQQQRYFDISMGTGTMVIGLASVIIGISLLKKVSFIRVTTSVIIGSIIYKACVAIAIKLGMPSSDLKMITAVLFLVILVLGMDRKKRKKVA